MTDQTTNQDTAVEGEGVEATLKELVVLIDREASTKIPATVFDYELPVMEEIYGAERLFVHSEQEVDLEDFDVNLAYDGLVNKYARFPNELRRCYRNIDEFAKAVGVKATRGTSARGNDKQSSQKVRTPAKKAAKKAAK